MRDLSFVKPLNTLERRRLDQLTLQPALDERFPEEACSLRKLLSLTAGWLTYLGFAFTAVEEAVRTLLPQLREHAALLTEAERGEEACVELPQLVLAIADGRYLGCSDRQSWFDLEQGESLEESPSPAIQVSSLDLNAAYAWATTP